MPTLPACSNVYKRQSPLVVFTTVPVLVVFTTVPVLVVFTTVPVSVKLS